MTTTSTLTYSQAKTEAIQRLVFDDVAHRYTLRGAAIGEPTVVVPGVTSVIDPLTGIHRLPPDILERARERGNAVHLLTEAWDTASIDRLMVAGVADDEGYTEYLDAWRTFVRDTGAHFTAIEQRVYHAGLQYAGTLDRVGSLGSDTQLHLFDVKSGDNEKEYGLQTAAYKEAWNEDLLDDSLAIHRRYVVQLKPNGKYALHEHRDKLDWAAFKAALTIHRWRSRA